MSDKTINQLRSEGYLVIVFSPDELRSTDIDIPEEILVERGNDCIAQMATKPYLEEYEEDEPTPEDRMGDVQLAIQKWVDNGGVSIPCEGCVRDVCAESGICAKAWDKKLG